MKVVNTGNNEWEVWHDDDVFVLGPYNSPEKALTEMLEYMWDSIRNSEDDDIPF